jgi:ubiquinone/menaquinone biosynthesis C-methylase UbiE
MLGRLIKYISGTRTKDIPPADAYDLWSRTYDHQADNLMLALDEELFTGLLRKASPEGKSIIDVGCGTGRHWDKILAQQPRTLTGYDVSSGMLEQLKLKYPQAHTVQLNNSNQLPQVESQSVDLIISTLTIAHIENLEEAFGEWQRALAHNGEIIITDYHPETLEKGGKRTFRHNMQTLAVKNFTHSIEEILHLTDKMNWELQRLEERKIDDTVRSYYEKKNATHVFEKFKGLPIIFGMHLRNKHASA